MLFSWLTFRHFLAGGLLCRSVCGKVELVEPFHLALHFLFFFAGFSSSADVQSAKCFPAYSVCQNRCHIRVPFIVSSMHSSPQISSDFDTFSQPGFNISLVFGVYVSTLRADGPNFCCEIKMLSDWLIMDSPSCVAVDKSSGVIFVVFFCCISCLGIQNLIVEIVLDILCSGVGECSAFCAL